MTSTLLIIKRRGEWKKAFLMGFTGVMLNGISSVFCKIVVSETDSLPEHYFLHLPFMQAKKGQYTLTYSKWYQGKIIKKIIGAKGDRIWYDKDGLLWVGETKVGRLKQKASDGNFLTPIKPQVIPERYVFLYSNHPNSFDSRYEELGLIPVAALKGRLIALR